MFLRQAFQLASGHETGLTIVSLMSFMFRPPHQIDFYSHRPKGLKISEAASLEKEDAQRIRKKSFCLKLLWLQGTCAVKVNNKA